MLKRLSGGKVGYSVFVDTAHNKHDSFMRAAHNATLYSSGNRPFHRNQLRDPISPAEEIKLIEINSELNPLGNGKCFIN